MTTTSIKAGGVSPSGAGAGNGGIASQVRALVREATPGLVALRRELHEHPELCYEERWTSARVARELASLGIEHRTGLAGDGTGPGTGVIGYLPATVPGAGGSKAGAIALRADMDALPIEEATGKPWSSKNPGRMHACGHDGHTAMLLGAAGVLSKVERPRPVLLVFQPAEEGGGGADRMCREGVLDGAGKGGLGEPVSMMFGLHGWPTREVGTVASRAGALLASTDDFEVTVRGVQSHGAYPHYGRDSILAASQVIVALQSIASRNVGPLDSVVVTVGAISAGTADNIIPETCRFIGTIRTLTDETRALAKERFFAVVDGVCGAMGCRAEIVWKPGYPVTVNDAGATGRFFEVARRVLGPGRVEEVEHATMGGEDFAYYGQRVPACFYLLGLRPPGRTHVPTLHQPDFDFNDEAIPTGVEMMVELALRA